MKPLAMHNGNNAILQNTLFAEPFLFNPTLEKMSFKDRRFSQIAKKITRKARITPQSIVIDINKLRAIEIVISCGNVLFEEPLNAIIVAKYRVTKSQTMRGPFVSANFLDVKVFPFFRLYTRLFILLARDHKRQK